MTELEVPETHVLAVASHVGVFNAGTTDLQMLTIVKGHIRVSRHSIQRCCHKHYDDQWLRRFKLCRQHNGHLLHADPWLRGLCYSHSQLQSVSSHGPYIS
jgi:hypothetical protein